MWRNRWGLYHFDCPILVNMKYRDIRMRLVEPRKCWAIIVCFWCLRKRFCWGSFRYLSAKARGSETVGPAFSRAWRRWASPTRGSPGRRSSKIRRSPTTKRSSFQQTTETSDASEGVAYGLRFWSVNVHRHFQSGHWIVKISAHVSSREFR